MFCPLGAMKLGVQQKKLLHLIQPSQDPTYIYFFLIQGLRVRVEMGTKSEKVCMCVCVCVCMYVTFFCWRLFHLISPRSEVTFGSNLVWCLLYMGH